MCRGGEEITPDRHRVRAAALPDAQPAPGAVARPQILDRVWNYDFGGQANVVELYISYLRKKIDAGREPMIHTMRGAGYVLKPAELSRCAAPLPPRSPSRLVATAGRAGRRSSRLLVARRDHAWRCAATSTASSTSRSQHDPATRRSPRGRRQRRAGRPATATATTATGPRFGSATPSRHADRAARPRRRSRRRGHATGRRRRARRDVRAGTSCDDVPADGQSHVVDLPGVGDYRVRAVSRRRRPRSVAGLPTAASTTPSPAWCWSRRCSALARRSWSPPAPACSLVRRQLRPLREVAGDRARRWPTLPLSSGEIGTTVRVPDDAHRRAHRGRPGRRRAEHAARPRRARPRRRGTAASSRCASSSPTPPTSCARR